MKDRARPRRSLLSWLFVLLVVVAILVVVNGSIRRTARPRVGDFLSTNTGTYDSHARASFRIALLNARSGRGGDGRVDLRRTASLLQSFDVIGLNEVRGRLFGSPANQAEEIARLLRSPWMFAPSERRFWHDSFGNALLSHVPVHFYQVINLPSTQWAGDRNVLLAKISLETGTLNLLITHLDRTNDRPIQFRAVKELFLALEPPAILMGDLNTTAGDVLMKELLQTAGVSDVIGDTDGVAAKERVDWILIRGMEVLEAGAVESDASDHPMVWAHLTIAPVPLERPSTTKPAKSPRRH